MVTIEPIRVETEREDDGRILASVPDLPGVMAYGTTDLACMSVWSAAKAKGVYAALVRVGCSRSKLDLIENYNGLAHRTSRSAFTTASK